MLAGKRLRLRIDRTKGAEEAAVQEKNGHPEVTTDIGESRGCSMEGKSGIGPRRLDNQWSRLDRASNTSSECLGKFENAASNDAAPVGSIEGRYDLRSLGGTGDSCEKTGPRPQVLGYRS